MHTGAADVVAGGSLPLAILLALAAGVISFASPCVLPLVPGFLGYVTGLTDEKRRTRLVTGALLFVLGFSVVFVSLAYAAGTAATFLRGNHELLMRVGGAIVIVLALVYLGFVGQRGIPIQWRPAAGLVGAPLLGAVFGLGMSPCIGPVLGAIVSLSASMTDDSGDIRRGVLLAAFYSLGMGLPFLLIAAGWSRAEKASRWLRDHHRPIQLVGGVLMLLVGVLMVAGVWDHATAWLQTNLTDQFKTAL
ncbi:cytochrome c biogenesis CcdA family protein [Luteipulveratus sp. YIM 133132]|uniref:Cytochrome c biogenesis CcdA family protein n=1 Tax=Luteipulveratus flavus TaxID=3031728 RepID=A0ABT6C790_9MICO|nr:MULTISPECIES: cytochrome c biogenesis CcdA family protein [unclassified Luteipulveratus]MDE9365020.1 cytochrome c biogenesis CcdA family protein [Luteipulveratus sp. YIM 133132]MDF8264640.1 cytochrome c biogenesis CcdA family protein [Luteipulveratus sp. YIM 133296]